MCVGDSPPLAGRSPSHMVRQIWDIQQGSRNNEEAHLMKLAIANLTPDDKIVIAAYVSSRKPVYSALKLEGVATRIPSSCKLVAAYNINTPKV